MDVDIGQIVAQIIAFLLMLAVLKRFAWKPLLKLMDERRERIHNELAAIERNKQEVDALRTEYKEKLAQINSLAKTLGQEELTKARIQAKEIEEEAHRRGREIMNIARITGEAELDIAKEHLKDNIVTLTLAATQAILKKNMDSETQRELISRYIAEASIK